MKAQPESPVTPGFPKPDIALELLARQVNNPARMQAILVGCVMVISAAVRLIAINAVGYNSDEAVYSGQAAAIIREPVYTELFPVFRAHPLLFHVLLSFVYLFGVSDVSARILSAAFGIGTVYITYRLGKELYGDATGIVTAILLALMPYHVIVTRQVLLDGPLTFFTTLAAFMIARFARTEHRLDLFAMGAALGLAFLSKETGLLFFGSAYAFFALAPAVRIRIQQMIPAAATAAALLLVYPLTVTLAGAGTTSTAQQYFVWQFFRFPNHTWDFYLRALPFEIGPLVILLAFLGLLLLWNERSWRETLLVCWIVVPVVFFQLWPTKGFQYLLPIAPMLSVLAGRTLGRWFFPRSGGSLRKQGQVKINQTALAVIVVAFSLLIPTVLTITGNSSSAVLAGSGGIPGGRETGEWIAENLPEGSSLMTIGPSMANILQFYGHQRAYGLSVSANPLYRNPSYTPIDNPDLQILRGEIQYLIWDAFSARRSSFFSEKLLGYVQKYNGRVIRIESIPLETAGGETVEEPIIIVYRVYP